MNAATNVLPFAAQATGAAAWLEAHFGKNIAWGPLAVGLVGVLAVAAILVCWAIVRWQQHRSKKPMDHPWRLLRELAQAHGLRRSEERLLHQIVRRYGIEPPARLLLEPERFQTAASDELFQRERQVILHLKNRLFDVR
jgi:hypothetical protein